MLRTFSESLPNLSKSPVAMKNLRPPFRRLALAAVASFCLEAPLHATTITANFTGGNSSTVADAYTGTTGGGWLAGWRATDDSSTAFANTATTANPLNGSGSHLAATLNYNGTATFGSGAVGRKFDPAVVSSGSPYTVTFDLRLDSALANGSDKLVIFGDVSSGYAFSTGAANTFCILGNYNSGSPTWYVLDGSRDGSGGTTSSTGIALTQGTVYHFTVNVDPATRSWTVLVDNGSASYQSPSLGFRAAPSADGGNAVYFGASVRSTTGAVAYSVDNVAVAPTGATAGSGFPTEIAANFTPGTLVSHVDGYTGTSGAGWLDGWSTHTSSSTFTNIVSAASPLRSGGNYLAATLNVTGTATSASGAIGRKFDTRAVNDTLPYSVAFDIRLDSAMANGSDKLLAFGDVSTSYVFSTGSGNTFCIQGIYNGGSPVWTLLNGSRDGSGGSTVNTGVALTQGAVYRFLVNVDPPSRSWTVSIDDGSSTYQSGALGYRAASSSEGGNTLYFGAAVRNTTAHLSYSLDHVVVTTGSSSLIAKDWPSRLLPAGSGIATHFNTYVDFAMAGNASAMDLARDAGWKVVRYNMPWQDVERTVGSPSVDAPNNLSYTPGYRTAETAFTSRGFRPILCLAFQNTQYSATTKLNTVLALEGFQAYCQFIARTFRDDNPIFEIWNEPNLSGFGGYDSAEYVLLVQYAVQGILAGWRDGRDTPDLANPIIIGPSVANSWASGNMFDNCLNDGLLDYVDALSFHPYSNSNGDPTRRIPETLTSAIDSLKAELVRRGKSYVPLVVTEWGWSTGTMTYEIDEATQAKFAARQVLMGYYTGLAINCIYSLEDARNDTDRTLNDKHYGMFKTSGANYQKVMTAKPAVAAVTAVHDALSGYCYVQRVTLGSTAPLNPANDWCLVFWNPTTQSAKAAIWTTESSTTKSTPDLAPLLNLSSPTTATFTDSPTFIDLPGYRP